MRARSLLLAFAALSGLTMGAVGIAGAADDNKCKLAIKGDSPTKAACDRGGRKEAAKTMKGLVKTAKAKGTVFVCDDCHKNSEDYALTDNAKNDFEKLLAAQK